MPSSPQITTSPSIRQERQASATTAAAMVGLAVSPIDPATGQEPHTSGIAARQQSEAVQLYLVNPSRPGWGLWRGAGQARLDEAIWPGYATQ
jgi:hypothetical protein